MQSQHVEAAHQVQATHHQVAIYSYTGAKVPEYSIGPTPPNYFESTLRPLLHTSHLISILTFSFIFRSDAHMQTTTICLSSRSET